MPEPAGARIIPYVVSRHAEDAAFEWLRRDRAVDAPHYQLRQLVKLDDRVEANLDGLRIAGEPGWPIVEEALRFVEPGEVFVAGVLALESADPSRFALVTDKVASTPDTARGLVSALAWVSRDAAAARTSELLTSSHPILRSVGIAGSVVHTLDPGVFLTDAFGSDEPELRSRAFAAVGRLARTDLLPALDGCLKDPVPECRFWAAWASAFLGSTGGVAALRRMAEVDGPFRERAAATAGRLLEHRKALGWQRDLARDPSGLRAALAAAGAIGDPALVPWLIEHMEDATTARAAGEAFSMMTGADLVAEQLERTVPPAPDGGPTDSPDDDDVSSDVDDDLAWPEPTAVADWARRATASLRSGTRYLIGMPLDDASLAAALRQARQRQRAAAAFELAVRTHARPFDVRAPGRRQVVQLGAGPRHG